MNIVLDEAFEEKDGGEKVAIGMIVRYLGLPLLKTELTAIGHPR
jgi:small nuclear ribonucleoprotein (snRNP)-like protein